MIYDFTSLFLFSFPMMLGVALLVGMLPVNDFITKWCVYLPFGYFPLWFLGMLGGAIGYIYTLSRGEVLQSWGSKVRGRNSGCDSFVNIVMDFMTDGPSCRETVRAENAADKILLNQHFTEHGLSSPIVVGFSIGILVAIPLYVWFFSRPKPESSIENHELRQHIKDKYGFDVG